MENKEGDGKLKKEDKKIKNKTYQQAIAEVEFDKNAKKYKVAVGIDVNYRVITLFSPW